MEEHKIFKVISIRAHQKCLIKLRDNYYEALALPCSTCGLDFKLLEQLPFTLGMNECGWDSIVLAGYYFAHYIKEDPTLIIPYGENDISFWKNKKCLK